MAVCEGGSGAGADWIFNRSYYEEVLVVKVHPELIAGQRIPNAEPAKEKFWERRYEDINAFEKHLTNNGTAIVKFFLNLSQEKQRERFLERIDDPAKNWKFSPSDLRERALWGDYMKAYEQCIEATSTEQAPWYIIPADHKWVTRAAVAVILAETIRSLNLKWPAVGAEQKRLLAEARAELGGD